MIFNQLPDKDNPQQGQGCSCQPSLGCGACFLYFFQLTFRFIAYAVCHILFLCNYLLAFALMLRRDVHTTFPVALGMERQTAVVRSEADTFW